MKSSHRRVALASVLALAAGCGGGAPSPERQPPRSPPPAAVAQPAATSAEAEDAGTPPTSRPPEPAQLTARSIALPGADGHATLDYLVFEPAHGRVWVPVAETGSVDVLDPALGRFTRVDGFKNAEREVHGKKRFMGPSSGSFGDGFVYVGNRASNEVCPVDVGTLKPAKCVNLAVPPDGLLYIGSAKELWVTTPKDSSVTVLDASKPGTLTPKATIKTPGSPEGYAVDEGRGLFFTNLEDKDQTVVIDVKTHEIAQTWPSACGGDGPRGIAVDPASRIVMVGCTDHLQTFDGGHDGAELAKMDTGAGVDNIEWVPSKRLLYVGAAKAAKFSIIHIDEKGLPRVVAAAATPPGTRNPVVDSTGTAYLADPMDGGIVVIPFIPSHGSP